MNILTNTWKTLINQYDPLSSSPSKLQYSMNRALDFFSNSSRIYLPVHAILFLIRWRRFMKNPTQTTYKAIKGWFKSCLFATLFAMSYPVTGAYLTQYSNGINSWSCFAVSFAFSWFILLESSSRWGEMSVWVLSQWFEAMILSSIKNKYYFEIPGGSVSFIFYYE